MNARVLNRELKLVGPNSDRLNINQFFPAYDNSVGKLCRLLETR